MHFKLTGVSDLFSGAFNLIKAIRLRPETLQNSYFPIKASVATTKFRISSLFKRSAKIQ